MSYVIQAIVADHNLLSQKVFPNAFVVSLPQGKGMIPLTDEIVQAHKIPSWPFTDEGIKPPRGAIEAVVKLCAPFSLKGKAAYIEAEFFGGWGTQACLLFEGGNLSGKLIVGKDAINQALSFLGVVKTNSDEFDALGLGAHSVTEDWIKNQK